MAEHPDVLRRIELAKAGDQQAASDLLRDFTPLVWRVMGRYGVRERDSTADDLAATGLMTVWRAILAYEPGRGVKFISYATWRLRGEVGRAVHRDRRGGDSLEAMTAAGYEPPARSIGHVGPGFWSEAHKPLNNEQSRAVRRVFRDGATRQSVAKEMGLSPTAFRRLLAAAQARVRRRIG